MPLARRIVPLRYVPGGTSTVPPVPAQASIAAWSAAVSFVVPSPLAPWSRTPQIGPVAAATAEVCAVSAPAPHAAKPRKNKPIERTRTL